MFLFFFVYLQSQKLCSCENGPTPDPRGLLLLPRILALPHPPHCSLSLHPIHPLMSRVLLVKSLSSLTSLGYSLDDPVILCVRVLLLVTLTVLLVEITRVFLVPLHRNLSKKTVTAVIAAQILANIVVTAEKTEELRVSSLVSPSSDGLAPTCPFVSSRGTAGVWLWKRVMCPNNLSFLEKVVPQEQSHLSLPQCFSCHKNETVSPGRPGTVPPGRIFKTLSCPRNCAGRDGTVPLTVGPGRSTGWAGT